jgi:putative transcriptional regulator
MEIKMTYRHGFLIATTAHKEHPFIESVIYLCEHSAHGALGLILNKPLDMNSAASIKKKSNLDPESNIYIGGLIQYSERGFILHRNFYKYWNGTTQLAEDLFLTSTQDIMGELKKFDTEDYRVFLGYTGWQAGQLEDEIAKDYWIFLPYNDQLIFSNPSTLWAECYAHLGFSPYEIVCVDKGALLEH